MTLAPTLRPSRVRTGRPVLRPLALRTFEAGAIAIESTHAGVRAIVELEVEWHNQIEQASPAPLALNVGAGLTVGPSRTA